MYLVIADRTDHAALWLRSALSPLLAQPVVHVTPAQLVYSTGIVHRLDTHRSHSHFRLADGALLDFDRVAGVVNRMAQMPTAHLERAPKAERDYAATELHAFLIGWMASLDCPVLNPPSPEWLGGSWHAEMVAVQLAAQVGLVADHPALDSEAEPQVPGRGGSGGLRSEIPCDIHVAVCGRLIGPMIPHEDRDALLGFAHAWEAPMLEIATRAGPAGRSFVRATSFPDFARAGLPLARAVAGALSA